MNRLALIDTINSRIGRRLILWMILLGTLMATALTLITGVLDYRNQFAAIQLEMDRTILQIREGLSLALWNFSNNEIDAHIKGVVMRPGTHYASLEAPDGKTIARAGYRPTVNSIVRETSLTYEYGDRVVPLGTLRFESDKSILLAQLRSEHITRFVRQMILISLLLGTALVMFNQMVTRHLNAASRFFKTLDIRKAATPLVLDRKTQGDELDILVDAINSMIENLGQAYRSLEESKSRIAESQQRLQLATRSAGLGVWDWNVVDNHMVWDDHMIEMYGYTRETFPGGVEAWRNGLHPEDRDRAWKECEEALRGRKEFDTEFRVQWQNGTVRHLKANGLVIRDAEGRPLRMLGINYDITEWRRTEAQLIQAQKMESIGRLAGGVAHDFNNKLMVILGYASMASYLKPGDDRLQDYLQEIIKAAENSRDITAQMLAFSKQQVINPRPIDVNLGIESMKKSLGRLIGEDITLSFEPCAHAWTVSIDPVQLDQVIMNLAVNARDAMPNGGTISLSTNNVNVTKKDCQGNQDAQPGPYVKITFRDSGTGMNSEVLQHIFEPFFTTKGIGQGTGLGLATIYGIVTQNGGFIEVESEPGKGTEFRIYLPRHGGEQEVVQCPTYFQKPAGTGTVLLVEDEVAVRRLARTFLEDAGYTVLEASSPQNALAIASDRAVTVDILLTDVVMPVMNGKELSERITAIRPGLPTVFISGYPSVSNTNLEVENFRFIQKPFSAEKLCEAIRAAVNR